MQIVSSEIMPAFVFSTLFWKSWELYDSLELLNALVDSWTKLVEGAKQQRVFLLLLYDLEHTKIFVSFFSTDNDNGNSSNDQFYQELTVVNILLALFHHYYTPLRYKYNIISTLQIGELKLTKNMTNPGDESVKSHKHFKVSIITMNAYTPSMFS